MVCYALRQVGGITDVIEDPSLDRENLNVKGGRRVTSQNFFGPTAFFDRDLQEILTMVEARCGAKSSKPSEFADAAAAARATQAEMEGAEHLAVGTIGLLEASQASIDQDNVTWGTILEWLTVLIGLLTAIQAIVRFVPFVPLRLAAAPLPLVIRRAAGFQGAIIARRAANDRLWNSLGRQIALLKAA